MTVITLCTASTLSLASVERDVGTDRRVCWMCDDIIPVGRRNHRKLLSCVSDDRLVQNNVVCAMRTDSFRCSGIQGEKKKEKGCCGR
jgi:hypothetical protein